MFCCISCVDLLWMSCNLLMCSCRSGNKSTVLRVSFLLYTYETSWSPGCCWWASSLQLQCASFEQSCTVGHSPPSPGLGCYGFSTIFWCFSLLRFCGCFLTAEYHSILLHASNRSSIDRFRCMRHTQTRVRSGNGSALHYLRAPTSREELPCVVQVCSCSCPQAPAAALYPFLLSGTVAQHLLQLCPCLCPWTLRRDTCYSSFTCSCSQALWRSTCCSSVPAPALGHCGATLAAALLPALALRCCGAALAAVLKLLLPSAWHLLQLCSCSRPQALRRGTCSCPRGRVSRGILLVSEAHESSGNVGWKEEHQPCFM